MVHLSLHDALPISLSSSRTTRRAPFASIQRSGPTLFIGSAPNSGKSIKADLVAHLKGERGACTQEATHYGWELSQDPKRRELELLKEYLERHRAYPRCNQKL